MRKRKVWWISCRVFTVRVVEEGGVIVEGAPLIRKFIGQPFENLKRWAARIGGLRMLRVEED